jgi:hypothetical protein
VPHPASLGLRFLVGIFQGDEVGFLGLSHNRLELADRRARGFGARPRTHLHGLEDPATFGAGDRGVIEVIKLGAAMSARTLRTKL